MEGGSSLEHTAMVEGWAHTQSPRKGCYWHWRWNWKVYVPLWRLNCSLNALGARWSARFFSLTWSSPRELWSQDLRWGLPPQSPLSVQSAILPFSISLNISLVSDTALLLQESTWDLDNGSRVIINLHVSLCPVSLIFLWTFISKGEKIHFLSIHYILII